MRLLLAASSLRSMAIRVARVPNDLLKKEGKIERRGKETVAKSFPPVCSPLISMLVAAVLSVNIRIPALTNVGCTFIGVSMLAQE